MGAPNSARQSIDPAILKRLHDRIEAAKCAFELASESEKADALLYLDRVTTEFTDALLDGKLPSDA